MTTSQNRFAAILLLALVTSMLMGCGGGGSHSSSSKNVARAREIATTRLTRSTLAIVGLGRKLLTKSTGIPGSRRVQLISRMLAPSSTRSVTTGYDSDLLLYYSLTVNPDSSGSELLFSDAARTIPAGSFIWGAPKWSGNVPNTYPAVIHVVYQILAGPYAQTSGTIDITLQDAAGIKSLISVTLSNAFGEKCSGDYVVDNNNFSSQNIYNLADGSVCTCSETEDTSGEIMCMLGWTDGSSGFVTVNPDGTTTATITDNDGGKVSGDVQPDGTNSIDFADGSTETNDDNTTSEDGSGDSSNQSLIARQKSKSIKRPTLRK